MGKASPTDFEMDITYGNSKQYNKERDYE